MHLGVDEIARGFSACAVFMYYPLYWICYNQSKPRTPAYSHSRRH